MFPQEERLFMVKNIKAVKTPAKVKALADATDACWSAILAHNLDAFVAAYKASFEAQIAMFPGMVNPSVNHR